MESPTQPPLQAHAKPAAKRKRSAPKNRANNDVPGAPAVPHVSPTVPQAAPVVVPVPKRPATAKRARKVVVPAIQQVAQVPDDEARVLPKSGWELTYYEASGASTTVTCENLQKHVSNLYSTQGASVFEYNGSSLTIFPLLQADPLFVKQLGAVRIVARPIVLQ